MKVIDGKRYSAIKCWHHINMAKNRTWFVTHCSRPAENDHINGPGICPGCGHMGLRLKNEAPGFQIAACDFCKKGTLI